MAKQQQRPSKLVEVDERQPPGDRDKKFAPTPTNQTHKLHQTKWSSSLATANVENENNLKKQGYNNKAEKFLSRGAQAIIRMRGLPFTCSAKQVVDFFASSAGISTCQHQNHGGNASQHHHHQLAAAGKQRPCEVLAGEDGVLFVKNGDEKPTGDAFVLFASEEQAKRALARHHQNIGSRYVELFRSTVSEVQQVLSSSTSGQHQNGDELKATGQKSTSSAGNRENKQAKTQTNINSNQQQQQQPRLVISNKNAAFPALTSKPVAWCRSEKITYAQVAHSKESAAKNASSEVAKFVNETSEQSEQSSNREVEKKSVDKKATKQINGAVQTLSQASRTVKDSTAAPANENVSTTTAPSSKPTMVEQTPVEVEVDGPNATAQSAVESDGQQQEVSSVNSNSFTPQAHSPNSSLCSSSLGHNSASSSSSTWRQTGPNQQQTNAGGYQNSRRHNNSNNYQQHASRQNSRYNHQHDNATTQHNLYSAIHQQQSLAFAAAGYAMGLPLDASQHHAMALAQSQPLPLAPAVSHYSNHHHNPYAYGPNQAHGSQQMVAGTPQSSSLSPADSLGHHPHAAAYYPIATSAAAAHYIAAAAAAAAAAAMHQQQVPNSSNATAPTTSSNRSGIQTSSLQSGTSKATTTSEQVAPAAAPASNSHDPQLTTSQRDCIRLRGLPFEAQIEDVISFLGRHSEFVLYQGVHMVYSAQGQPTGEAIIQMSSCEAAAAVAQESHRRVMSVGKKQRYIEVIPSSIDDLKPTLGYGLASFAAGRAAAAAAAAYNQLPAAGMHHHYPATTTAGNYLAPNMTDHHHHNQPHHLPAMIYDDKMAAMMREPSQAGECPASSGASPCCGGSADTSATGTPSTGETVADRGRDAIGSPSTHSSSSSSGCATSSSVGQTSDDQQTLTSQESNFDGANAEQLDHSHNQVQLQQQQQQALMAATAAAQAAAAAYYPIFYYYPPQQMLATAPTANTSPYH